MPRLVTIACEGQIDHDAIAHVCACHGVAIGPTYVAGGAGDLDRRMGGYVNASRHSPWIIQRDLDRATCAPALRDVLVAQVPPLLNLLVTIRQTEAWFLADVQAMASFCNISHTHVPLAPETLPDAKAALLALVRRSRRRDLRADVLPAPESGRRTGPADGAQIAEFIRDYWSIDRAIAGGASSLGKLVERIERYKRYGHWQRRG